MLWEKFDLEDSIRSILDTDYFIDPIRPGVPVPIFKHIKPIPISLAPSQLILNKKRLVVED
jgi:hypothetical protein